MKINFLKIIFKNDQQNSTCNNITYIMHGVHCRLIKNKWYFETICFKKCSSEVNLFIWKIEKGAILIWTERKSHTELGKTWIFPRGKSAIRFSVKCKKTIFPVAAGFYLSLSNWVKTFRAVEAKNINVLYKYIRAHVRRSDACEYYALRYEWVLRVFPSVGEFSFFPARVWSARPNQEGFRFS